MKNRDLYPSNWPDLARNCKEQAGWQCQHCGVAHGTLRKSRRGEQYPVLMNAAHKFPFDESNPSPELICLCYSCHANYDRPWLPRERAVNHERRKHQILLRQEGY